jgi:hypothetical protein
MAAEDAKAVGNLLRKPLRIESQDVRRANRHASAVLSAKTVVDGDLRHG